MADNAPWTVRRILEWTSGYFTRKDVFNPRLSAEQLLAHVLSCARIKLYTDYDRVLSEKDLAAYRSLVQRAAEDEPIAYLTGRAPFFNLEFHVTRDVLIPRPDTETLVENVLQYFRLQPGMEAPRVLDLCTGSGCVAASIAYHCKSATVTATELSPAAVAIARGNFQKLNLDQRITLLEGDLFEPLTGLADSHPFDVIASNPPYIRRDLIPQLDKSVKDFEPRMALDGGPDGLDFHRRILAESPNRLKHGGRIFLEIAFDQGPEALELAEKIPGLSEARLLKDAGGRDRVLTATRLGPA